MLKCEKKVEKEHKYLIDEEQLKEIVAASFESMSIIQGYISDNVRVRNNASNRTSCITLKGERVKDERVEYTYEIPYSHGLEIVNSMAYGIIYKTRYFIKSDYEPSYIWEVDIFHGYNSGLIIAEIEIGQQYNYKFPKWMGSVKEVTMDERYYNSYLSKKPFCYWDSIL